MELENTFEMNNLKFIIYTMVATKADITFAFNIVYQFMTKTSPLHKLAMKCIMSCLKSILDFRLCFIGKDIALRGFSIPNWIKYANDP